jgi:methionyl aminopeptidase
MAIPIRKSSDIDKLKIAGIAVAKTLNFLKENVKAGMTLEEVDAMGDKYIRSLGARPSFLGLYNFPNSVCTSLNEVVIHGTANDTVIQDGDILGLDIGSEVNGWYGDAAITMAIGEISKEDSELIKCSEDALYYAIDNIKVGMRFKELSLLLENFITQRGYVPLRNYCGHGIGRKAHDEPEIPNYLDSPNPKQGPKIKNGMVFCLEPMICQKMGKAIVLEDKWSVVSEDGLRTSHYEHTVAMVNNKAVILTQDN